MAIPDECERQITALPPPRVGLKDDLGVAAARYAAWGKANQDRIAALDACTAKVRAKFAAGD